MSNVEKRKRWRVHWAEHDAVYERWRAIGHPYPSPAPPPIPDDLRDLTCSAKTRAGTLCKIKAIYRNGRCKFHGGLSTGPKTPEGRAQSAINGRNGARRKAESMEGQEKLMRHEVLELVC